MRRGQTGLSLIAVLLIIVSVFLAVLAMLSLSTANADERLSVKNAEITEKAYKRECEGQLWLAQVDENLKDGAALSDMPDTYTENGVTVKTFTDDTNNDLVIGLKEDGKGSYSIVFWRVMTDWSPDTDIGELWEG